MIHQPVYVVSVLLNARMSGWLVEISADLREAEALRDDALYKYTYFIFLL